MADPTTDLADEPTRVLVALATHNNILLLTWKVAELSGLGEQLTLYHLTELQLAGFVQSNGKLHAQAAWELTHGGRGYLAKRGLLT